MDPMGFRRVKIPILIPPKNDGFLGMLCVTCHSPRNPKLDLFLEGEIEGEVATEVV